MSLEPNNKEIIRLDARIVALFGVAIVCAYSALHRGGFFETSRWVVSFVGLALTLLVLIRKRDYLKNIPTRLMGLWSLFLGWACVSTIFSVDIDTSISEILLLSAIFGLAMIVYAVPRDIGEINKLLFGLFAGAFIVTLVGFYFYFLGRFSTVGGHEMVRHFVGTFFWKNPMAGYLILFIPIGIGAFLYFDGITRWLFAIAVTIMFCGLVLTRSRAGWIAFILSFVIIFLPSVLHKTKIKYLIAVSVIFIIGIIIGIALAPPKTIADRAESITFAMSGSLEEQSFSDRIVMLKAGLNVVRDYPIFGIGPRSWPAIRAVYLHKMTYLPRFPHNTYLQFTAELGIPGIILFLLALAMTFIPLIRASYRREGSPISIGITSGAIALLLHMAVDFDSAFTGLMLPLALSTAMGTRLTSKGEPQEKGYSARFPIISLCILGLIALSLRLLSVSFLEEANKAVSRGDFKRAQENAHKASTINPFAWAPKYLSFNIHSHQGNYGSALVSIEGALRLAPMSPELHIGKALALSMLGDTMSAVNSYREAIALAPRASADAYLELANLLQRYGRPSEAENVLISMTEALRPFAKGDYTPQTAGFRYKIAEAWEKLERIWLARGDTAMAMIANDNAYILGSPRAKDYPLSQLGIDSPSPELVTTRFFEAIAKRDTNAISNLIADKNMPIPRFAEGKSLRVMKIIDVREDPSAGYAQTDILLEITEGDSVVGYSKSTISMVLAEKGWRIIMGKSD